MIEKIQMVQNLISNVSSINNKYEEIAENTGERFNVFKILKVEANEVKTHSAFLTELLNPCGTHGRKDAFLKLFLTQLKIEKFDTANCTIEENKFIGRVNESYTEGGYIDILISDVQGNKIIIENKIYAGDQKNQLIRYHKYDSKANLFYLTLDGHEPSEWSIKSEGFKINLITYQSDILEWLMKCQKEALIFPLLRETISQYINLIKHLTNQSINHNMEKEIIDLIIRNQENIKSAFLIQGAIQKVKQTLLEKLKIQLKDISEELSMEYKNIAPIITTEFKTECWLSFHLNNWERKNFRIAFEFEDFESEVYYGICRHNNEKTIDKNTLEILRRLLPPMKDDAKIYPFYAYFSEWQKEWDDILQQIADGRTMKQKIKNTIIDLIEKLKDVTF